MRPVQDPPRCPGPRARCKAWGAQHQLSPTLHSRSPKIRHAPQHLDGANCCGSPCAPRCRDAAGARNRHQNYLFFNFTPLAPRRAPSPCCWGTPRPCPTGSAPLAAPLALRLRQSPRFLRASGRVAQICHPGCEEIGLWRALGARGAQPQEGTAPGGGAQHPPVPPQPLSAAAQGSAPGDVADFWCFFSPPRA